MDKRLEIRKATPEDVDYLSIHMRRSDKREIEAFSGRRARQSLEMGMSLGEAYTAHYDGVPVLMFGVTSPHNLTGHGVPWMLVSNKMTIPPRKVLLASKRIVANMQHIYYSLENYVDVRNVAAIKWLKWLGFEFAPAIPIGKRGELFHRFFWKRTVDKMSLIGGG